MLYYRVRQRGRHGEIEGRTCSPWGVAVLRTVPTWYALYPVSPLPKVSNHADQTKSIGYRQRTHSRIIWAIIVKAGTIIGFSHIFLNVVEWVKFNSYYSNPWQQRFNKCFLPAKDRWTELCIFRGTGTSQTRLFDVMSVLGTTYTGTPSYFSNVLSLYTVPLVLQSLSLYKVRHWKLNPRAHV